MAVSADTGTHHVDMHGTSGVLACEPGAGAALQSPHEVSSRQPDGLRPLPHIRVAKGWGIKYTGTWTNEYLVQHPEQWHRVCNKIGAGDASHNDDYATMLCTGGAGVIVNRGFITGSSVTH